MNNSIALPLPLPAQVPQKLLFSKKEAAFVLSISIRKLEYLIENGEIAVRKIGKRVLIARSTLVAFARGDHA
jgi:excisionase family DNA binding protein